jgi:hypothetical protein
VNGFLVWESHETESNSGGVVVLLQGTETESGAVFAISYEGLSREDAMKAAQQFNWARMKTEAAKLK